MSVTVTVDINDNFGFFNGEAKRREMSCPEVRFHNLILALEKAVAERGADQSKEGFIHLVLTNKTNARTVDMWTALVSRNPRIFMALRNCKTYDELCEKFDENKVWRSLAKTIGSVDLSGLTAVTAIRSNFLCGCCNLQRVELSPLENVTDISGQCLADCTGLKDGSVDLSKLKNVRYVRYEFCDGTGIPAEQILQLKNVAAANTIKMQKRLSMILKACAVGVVAFVVWWKFVKE